LDNARERRFGNGREPRVLWKNHADFIAILLQSGGGSEGKTGIQDGGLLCRAMLSRNSGIRILDPEQALQIFGL
jgi:hypothetical protein